MSNTLRLSEDEARVLIARINKNAGRATLEPARDIVTPPPIPKGPSELEVMLSQQLDLLRLPAAVREYQAIPGRKFRIDFAWPDRFIGVEVQGMVHRIKGRFLRDTEKSCLHILHGWRVLPVSGNDIRSGRAASWITTLLEGP